MPFEPTGFSKDIFEQRYAIPGETWSDFCTRVATHIASAENDEKKIFYTEKFYEIISENKFIPGGRINYGSGRHNYLCNCYVGNPEMDS